MIGPQVAVAIATYRRPKRLNALLDSIIASRTSVEPKIVVVDNDPSESARATVERRVEDNIVYVAEPRPGISYARNTGISKAGKVEYIAFVDDDETVSKGWIEALIGTLEAYDSDAVTGPIVAVLSDNCPEWIVKSGLFNHKRLATGTFVEEAGAGNFLVRRSVLEALGSKEWFRPDLGLTGGEDADLCRRLAKQGNRIVWCDDAVVTEIVPSERTRFWWLVRRYRRFASVDFLLDDNSELKRIRAIVGGVARISSGLLKLGFVYAKDNRIDAGAFRRACRGVGFVEAATGKFTIEYARK